MARPTFLEAIILHICRYYGTAFCILGRALALLILKVVDFICSNLCCKVVNSPEAHAKKVDHVKKQILDWNKNGRTKLCTARPGWKSMSLRIPAYKKTMTGIDLSSLDEVVKIDENSMTLTVEPLVKMGPLTKILDAKGWTIPVVPELDFLTVGGLICGAGVETSSHKYGLFHNTCISYEVVLASGEVVNASKDENSDLFYAIPGSYGTLGFLTAATIRIFKAEKLLKTNNQFDIVYPVWLCPAKGFNEPGFFKFEGNPMYMDIGIYGQSGKPDEYETDKSNKALEQFCLQNKCMARPRFFEAVILHICRYYVTPFLVIGRAVTLPILNILESISANLCCRVVNSPEVHAKKVDHVKKQILDWNANGRRTKLCTARSGWKSMSLRIPTYKATMTGIDLDSLDEVGWTIPVVPELDFLTVGGLICGAGLETSSHKYGLFHNTCISYEVVLASGEAVNANKDENSDLFYAIPGSYGTIGFLTSATIRIFKAEKYVKLSCIPVNSLAEATERITEESLKSPGPDFVEGIMYSLDKGVIMVGSLSSKAEPGKINSVTRWYKKSFYKHVETFLSSSQLAPKVEYIPLRDYYHRHTYCIFWIGPQYIPYVNNALFRLIFGWTGPGDNYTYKIMPPYFRRLFEINMVVQDLVVPIDKTKMALQYFHDTVEVCKWGIMHS
ncbi:Delta(24)-sterol reductase [Folsomia candida]|uniref:Delta(24)-sterol reductase n=1 Tax=Folsomia candida TaxID=158441 RepID=A0A226D2Q2_FOLCA|nr:Delta(24)-sterol reductase [Folsomia candida]